MRMCVLCALMLSVCFVSACSNTAASHSSNPSYSYKEKGRIIVRNGVEVPPSAEMLGHVMPAAGDNSRSVADEHKSVRESGAPPEHCRLKDRFDRREVIAYHFSDGQSKLGLDLDVDGFSLSELGDFELDGAFINFRHRFQPIKKRREKCLYGSPWQGLLGSGYNEFVKRETHTVYEELDQELDRAQRRINDLFSYLP